ncbi:MAG: Nucleolar protein 16 [Pycnora praestabilis]|nr:MAG: Nucleolar protein 16 [Pycnora praestabilis]
MGRELQKKKNRSSVPKIKLKPKSKKVNVLGNPIIAAKWNQSLTLSQNYKLLGLTSKINTSSGGTENFDSVPTNVSKTDALVIKSKTFTNLTPTEARIERDPTTGAILRVIHPKPSRRPNPLNDPLNDLSDADEVGDSYAAGGYTEAGTVSSAVVKELEEQASRGVKKAPRKQSTREEEWVGALVEKYGEDYPKMVRDRRLNPMQQSEGDIRRRVKRWRDSK